MGTWGCGIFDSDEALDWALELLSHDIGVVTSALEAVLPTTKRAADVGAMAKAVVASEVVACLGGEQSPELPADLAEWSLRRKAADGRLIDLALKATEAVIGASELLKEAWFCNDDFYAWQQGVRGLASRLSKARSERIDLLFCGPGPTFSTTVPCERDRFGAAAGDNLT